MLSHAVAVKKVEQEIAAFRDFEKLSQALIEVNQKICQTRAVEKPALPWTPEEKKRLMQSIKRLRAR
jgi:hypothetical protein